MKTEGIFLGRCLPYIIYIMLGDGKYRFYATIFANSLERLDSIILISIYISVKFSIHFGGHHLFQTIFGRHFSLFFYPCRHFNSFHFKKLRR